jgi:actin-related protein
VDNGSAVLKAGFSGEDLPQCVFPSIIGKSDSGQEAVLIGDQAYEKRK